LFFDPFPGGPGFTSLTQLNVTLQELLLSDPRSMCCNKKKATAIFIFFFAPSSLCHQQHRQRHQPKKKHTMAIVIAPGVAIIIALVAASTACTIGLTVATVVDKVQYRQRTGIFGAKGIMVTPLGSTRGAPLPFYYLAKNVAALWCHVHGSLRCAQMIRWIVQLPGEDAPSHHNLYFPLKSFTVEFRLGPHADARVCGFNFCAHHDGGEIKGYDISFCDGLFVSPETRRRANVFLQELVETLTTDKKVTQDARIVKSSNLIVNF
jgi:hypothetical protein